MGSYGDAWLRCCDCWAWGKCLGHPPPAVISLSDVDGVGLLCDGCSEARLSWRGRRYGWEDGKRVVLYCAACSAWQSCSTPTWDVDGDSSPVRLLCSDCCDMYGANNNQIAVKGECYCLRCTTCCVWSRCDVVDIDVGLLPGETLLGSDRFEIACQDCLEKKAAAIMMMCGDQRSQGSD